VAQPLFSVVIPTCDRPAFVACCLEALTQQTFVDFEVVVCDNYTRTPCRSEFDTFADERFRYVRPPRPLPMADNWEFAHLTAVGEYVISLTDKSVLLPVALERASSVIADTPEILSWWSDGYDLLNENKGLAEGLYRPYFNAVDPRGFEPRDVLHDRLAFSKRRGHEGVRYYWGKICFGAFHHSLIERIRTTMGCLFAPINPDYTSMAAALWCAERAIDVGEPLQLSFNSVLSNGRLVGMDPTHARRFLLDQDPTGSLLGELPITGLYTSLHNVVARDYEATLRGFGRSEELMVDRSNLAARVAEDLSVVRWTNRNEEQCQKARFETWCQGAGPDVRQHAAEAQRRFRHRARAERGRSALRRIGASIPSIAPPLRWVETRGRVPAFRCNSILEATRRATDRYAALRSA
jgi:hypothetical protein